MHVLPRTSPSFLRRGAMLAAVLVLPTLFFAHAQAQTACFTAWNASTAYTGGQTASYNSVNYTANWWTQGQNPASNSGGSGSGQPWTSDGGCAGSGGNGGGGGTGGGGNPPPVNPGANLYAPYVDMSLTPDEQLLSMQQQSGIKGVTMAFLVAAGGGCQAGWGGLGGTLPTDNMSNGTSILTVVQGLQQAGVQVVISFGGATGTEPALACTSASQLQALYQSVIDRYKVNMLDFDIEGGAVSNQASITLRDQALKALKAANPGLVISYTLPVLPTGLVSTGVNILQSATADGLGIDVVNVMAMDYGSSSDNGGQMGLDATDAASATYAQVKQAGQSSLIGVTPMIGINDTNTEIFQLSDVQTLLNFANSNSYINRLAIWSLARDNGGCAGQDYASPTCSGVTQSSFEYSESFLTF